MMLALFLLALLFYHVFSWNQYIIWHNRRFMKTPTHSTLYHIKFNSMKKNDIRMANNPESYELLVKEREKKRFEYFAADLAVRKYLQMNETKQSTDHLLKIEPNKYSFTAQYEFYNASENKVPKSAIILARNNFNRELSNIIKTYNIFTSKDSTDTAPLDETAMQLQQLKLSNEGVWKREKTRTQIVAPWVIKLPYYFLCYLLDALFNNAPISRFYFLETVARMPYFSYITMLHTYETLGWWRRSTETKRIHFAEEYNEFHHLLIMESLGGDKEWAVRFLAQHSAIVYYFILIGVWILSPTLAYNFSELIEAHAVDTYSEFLETNESLLRQIAAPEVAKMYYEAEDMYIFDEFQTNRVRGSRRPVVTTLYDVFCNIRDDECEHVNTMAVCQDPESLVMSPNTEYAIAASALAVLALTYISTVDSLPVEQYIKALQQNLPQLGSVTDVNAVGLDVDESVMLKETTATVISRILDMLKRIWPIFEL